MANFLNLSQLVATAPLITFLITACGVKGSPLPPLPITPAQSESPRNQVPTDDTSAPNSLQNTKEKKSIFKK